MLSVNKRVFKPANYSRPTDVMIPIFQKQQKKQHWVPEAIPVAKDKLSWQKFEHKTIYMKVLAGLTVLDTIQTNIGMTEIAIKMKDNLVKALLSLFGSMESIHAQSYSFIFMTLCNTSDIDEVMKWAEENHHLQYKASRIAEMYESIEDDDDETLWKAIFSSVMLESFLFYSGFFYPLYLGGQGVLRNSAEVIALILRDEALHGTAIGYIGQNIFKNLSKEKQDELKVWGYEFLIDLYENEMKYTDELYAEIGLATEVKAYVRYNANKALMNLGLDTMFPEEEINTIVQNGIRTDSVTHDFFSQKGNSYTIATVVPITDDTFKFGFEKEGIQND